MKTIALLTMLAGLTLATAVSDASAQGWGRGRGGCGGGYAATNCPVYQGGAQNGNGTSGPVCPGYGRGYGWNQGTPQAQPPAPNTQKQ